ncbi:unnamed protein product [Coffea canephora]|uniref:Uncharacterized protein n=1 Tax=Coffea canephora TaxID=49390 RepID=A0A068UU14_COFCA|nr:unnamed protein product [Coffea canephora]
MISLRVRLDEKKSTNENNAEDEKNDKVGLWYSNPGTGTSGSQGLGGGVGKYLKARNSQVESTTAVDSSLPAVSVTKKRKVGVSIGEYKDVSSW